MSSVFRARVMLDMGAAVGRLIRKSLHLVSFLDYVKVHPFCRIFQKQNYFQLLLHMIPLQHQIIWNLQFHLNG